ncbi:hypothetical protein ElyMa_005818400 [Elysia marginata]|uniref:Uncharacterized protein n=1 Tax=Elysia marginata TaxID=1093978 RepID=A0AAV4FVB4_9GAST|nr:hypothetical protein ElyMa_005818400 [Elysia marginata]
MIENGASKGGKSAVGQSTVFRVPTQTSCTEIIYPRNHHSQPLLFVPPLSPHNYYYHHHHHHYHTICSSINTSGNHSQPGYPAIPGPAPYQLMPAAKPGASSSLPATQ